MMPLSDLPGLRPERAPLARNWLKLAVLSLLASGLFSILLVLSRTPGIHKFIPWTDFFHIALVVHVDLSVVIWFLAFAGVFWTSIGQVPAWLNRAALWFMASGTAVIAIAPFLGADKPLMNNYVPVLLHPTFAWGGVMVLLGFGLLVLSALFARPPDVDPEDPQRMWRAGSFVAALISALALNALLSSYISTPRSLEPTAYFEFLFWGPGHLLQFTHSIFLLIAWLWLLQAGGFRILSSTRTGVMMLVLAGLPALAAPAIYFMFDVVSSGHQAAFTLLMKFGGLLLLPLGIVVVRSWLGGRDAVAGITSEQRIASAALLSSLLLFLAGGVIGFLIHGVNVVIPAHYHGSIVGVTLAFMGVAYLLLPRLGFDAPQARLAVWQPWIYGGGQLLHILGLAISGGYGNIQRKTAGAAQGLENLPELLGMGLMGLGGLIAIIGGLIFVILMLRAIWFRRAGEPA